MDSILISIKKFLGIDSTYTQFDPDVIAHINSALAILNQLGVGPEGGFSIKDEESLWSDFIGDNNLLETVKTYVYLKVKLIFDPPSSSSVIESIKNTISELEWRINMAAENNT